MARNFDSYIPVDVVSPIDGSVITMYNVKPEFRAAVQNVDASDSDIKRQYNGFELGFNARLPQRRPHLRRLQPGADAGRHLLGGHRSELHALLQPVGQRHSVGQAVQAGRHLPAAVVGDHHQHLAAEPDGLRDRHRAPFPTACSPSAPASTCRTVRAPTGTSCRRPATPPTAPARAGPDELVIPSLNLTSLRVPLAAPETEFMPRYNQLDLSFSKTFNMQRASASCPRSTSST